MKFVAKTSFHNAPHLALKIEEGKTDNFVHALTVPKGHRFVIAPDAESLDGVTKQAEKKVIAELVSFQMAVVDDGTPLSKDLIKRIDAEVAAGIAADKANAAKTPLTEEAKLAAIVAAVIQSLGVKIGAAAEAPEDGKGDGKGKGKGKDADEKK